MTATTIGYARVSTEDQNLTLQRDALNAAGCTRIFDDKLSATSPNRPGFRAALSHLRAGDTLVVWKLDRLGRNVRQLVDLVAELKQRRVTFKSLTESIDTNSPQGTFLFNLMAAFAQMEREVIVERTRAGILAAKARGRKGGRAKALNAKQIQQAKKYFAMGLGAAEIANFLGVHVSTLYRAIPPEERQVDAFAAN